MKFTIERPRPALIAMLAMIIVYALGGYAVARHLHQQAEFSFLLYSETVMEATSVIFFGFVFIRVWTIMLVQRPRHLTRTILADMHTRLFSARKLNAAIPIFVGFIVLMSAFTSVKGLIPLISPYHWDDAFIHLDRLLHGGVDPWRLLQPILGHSSITPKINWAYNFWFVVMFGILYWQLFDLRRPNLRMQFFWVFFLVWIVVGSILATVFSSMGPCFYEHIAHHGVNPFADQMKYLRTLDKDFPVWAVATQDSLWKSYSGSSVGMGTGISAMPSVHVSMATLFVLLSWSYGKVMRVFFVAFWLVIMAGSVHLAWHYAVDGYGGALVTIVMWFTVGAVLKYASKDVAKALIRAVNPGSSE